MSNFLNAVAFLHQHCTYLSESVSQSVRKELFASVSQSEKSSLRHGALLLYRSSYFLRLSLIPIYHPKLTLTRVSISRISWREMNVHVSFSSRFSKCWENISSSSPVSHLVKNYIFEGRRCLPPHLRLAHLGKSLGWKMKSSSLDQWVWMVVWWLEPSKITLWASASWLSSQARVTLAKSIFSAVMSRRRSKLLIIYDSFCSQR